jgi:putative radical SAM-modified peptide
MEPDNVAIEVLDEGIEEPAEDMTACCKTAKSHAILS